MCIFWLSQAFYICSKVAELKEKHKKAKPIAFSPAGGILSTSNVRSTSLPNLKVFIFSQFKAILGVIGDRLLRKFGQRGVAEYWGKGRNSELMRFKNDPG